MSEDQVLLPTHMVRKRGDCSPKVPFREISGYGGDLGRPVQQYTCFGRYSWGWLVGLARLAEDRQGLVGVEVRGLGDSWAVASCRAVHNPQVARLEFGSYRGHSS